LVALVDDLDETRAEPGDNPVPRFLPREARSIQVAFVREYRRRSGERRA
jgi:hypothetical protein